ncbi:MAG: hypothetical protein CMN30_27620 [Sandaracinus sp.]|nr:hypothetical protein [Sandaracinus sp.]
MRLALGPPREDRWIPAGVATVLPILAILEVIAWFVLESHYWPGPFAEPIGPFARDDLACLVLGGLYLLNGWIFAPLVFAMVVAADPEAPEPLGEQLTFALRATLQVHPLRRLSALVLSGAVLLGPLYAMAKSDDPWMILVTLGMFCAYVPIASALLVSRYAEVRDRIAGDAARVLRVPGPLVVFVGSAALLGGFAAWHASLSELLVLVALWFGVGLAFSSFVGAHRLGRLRVDGEVAPGRRALEGVVRGGHFHAGELRFALPEARADLAGPHTLVGDFAARREGFRESADQPWPRHGRLHPGELDACIERSVRRASARAWLLTGGAAAVAILSLVT